MQYNVIGSEIRGRRNGPGSLVMSMCNKHRLRWWKWGQDRPCYHSFSVISDIKTDKSRLEWAGRFWSRCKQLLIYVAVRYPQSRHSSGNPPPPPQFLSLLFTSMDIILLLYIWISVTYRDFLFNTSCLHCIDGRTQALANIAVAWRL